MTQKTPEQSALHSFNCSLSVADHFYLREEIETIRQALSARQWMPIESAPKDKIVLLGYFNKLGKWRMLRGRWFHLGEVNDLNEDVTDQEGWFEESVEADDLPNIWPTNPTHWMPLPVAPPSGGEG